MALPSIVTTTDTFQVWFDATNNLISHVANSNYYLIAGQTLTGTATVNGAVTLKSLTVSNSAVFGTTGTDTAVFNSSVTMTQPLTLTSQLSTTNVVATGSGDFGTTLRVAANAAFDTNVLFVDATNNRVGIGNATPGHALRVESTTSLNGAVNALSTLGVSGAVNALSTLGVTGTLTALGQMSVTANANFDSGTFFIDALNNRVGVGTTSPTTAVDVSGTVTATLFSGSGASLSSLNASNISSGSLNFARLGTVSGGRIIMGNASNQAEALAITGDVTFSSSGVTTIGSGKVLDAMLGTGINANKIGGGTVDNTEFGYLDGVTSAIQTQLNGKAATNQTMYIGTTAVAINRGSAGLSLTGVSIDGTAYGKAENALSVASAASATTATTATSAGRWSTARTFTIGSTGRSVDGTGDASWSLGDIGAAATNQTMHIGTTAVAINRGSASLSLTGVSIDGTAYGKAEGSLSVSTAVYASQVAEGVRLILNRYVGAFSGDGGSILFKNYSSNSDKWVAQSWYNGTEYFRIFSTGGSANTVAAIQEVGATGWIFTSDERTKELFGPIEAPKEKLSQLRTVYGKFKGDDTNRQQVFLIAQDVQKVLPEAVHVSSDKGFEDLLSLNHNQVLVLAIAAIKELIADNEGLKARLAALETSG